MLQNLDIIIIDDTKAVISNGTSNLRGTSRLLCGRFHRLKRLGNTAIYQVI